MLIFLRYRQREWNLLDNYRRQIFLKNEYKKLLLVTFSRSTYLPRYIKLLLKVKLVSITTLASISKQRNRCLLSGRQPNTIRKVQYSRFQLRFNAYRGLLPGCSRLSR